jgi:hypothetical protein
MEKEMTQAGSSAYSQNITALVAALGVIVLIGAAGFAVDQVRKAPGGSVAEVLDEVVLPSSGVALPIVWGDYGVEMTEVGVIDKDRFEQIYASRGGLSPEAQMLLYGEDVGSITMTPENANELLNIFWAFGLANKSPILEEGAMVSYGGSTPGTREERLEKAGVMASTGGWTISKGDAMNHYSAYEFVTLTEQEWQKVDRVAGGIYRPCCGNATNFPDCNHGMAMLGLLELMAARGVSEEEMYDVALAVNAYWFPSTYLTIAKLFSMQGVAWGDVDPKVALGYDYSSAEGFSNVLSQVEPQNGEGGGSCSI